MTIWRYPHATFMNFMQINFWFFISSGHEVVTHLRFLGVFFREEINRDVIGECQLPKYKIEVSYWATIKFRPLWILIPPRYKEKASDQMQILAILNRRLKEAHKINVVYLGSFFRFKSKSSLQVASVSTDLDPLESRGPRGILGWTWSSLFLHGTQALRNMEEERERLILARTKPTPRIGEVLYVGGRGFLMAVP